jgi:rare lipoprotein A
MRIAPFRLTGRGSGLLVISISALALAACSAPASKIAGKQRSKEYFSEREYGVKASPRVTNQRTRLPRGGGRDQTGKPYMVKGKWYHPKEEPGYRKAGVASWYGDAFHGRLTANGEIYDMTHLTAAHPTMPLPSYARVTNTKNGSSVIVRVNDRGPFAHGRVIDLSRRAAELLDYTHSGVARVEVEYIGRAPLHGRDDQFLMASYRPAGGRGPDPSDGLPSGVMIAMNGPTPPPAASPFEIASAELALPEFGPIVPERPAVFAGRGGAEASPALSYADARVAQAAHAVASLAGPEAGTEELVAALNRRYADAAPAATGGYVAIGTYADEAGAQTMASLLRDAGTGVIETDWRGEAFTLTIRPTAGRSLDDVLEAAWAAGATDAVPVRE